MDLDRVEFEVQRAARHIQAPQPRLGLPDQRHGLVPMTAEIRVPMMQRQRVMLTQVLLMDDLEARVMDLGLDLPGRCQLPIREYLAVDEGPRGFPDG